MKKTILLLGVVFILSGCSKDCSTWGKTILEDKTFKATKIEMNGVDVTSMMTQLSPCALNSVYFKTDGTYTTSNAAGCTEPTETGSWTTASTGGINTLTINGNSATVNSFDCDMIVITQTSQGSTVKMTFTKQ